MNAEKFSAAMGEIDDRYVSEALAYRPEAASPHLRHRLPAALAAAVAALLLMGCGVAAILYGDSIQSWFGHYWESITGQEMTEGQTAVIDHLSQEIGLSQTVDGVTVTVDSATVGDDSFCLLLRAEGRKFPARYGYGFSSIDMAVEPNPLEGSGGLTGYGFQYLGLDGDGSVLLLLDYTYASHAGYEQDLSPIDITLTLDDLVRSPNLDREKTLAEGQWSFHFSLDRSNPPQTIRLPDTQVMAMDLGKQESVPVTIKNIELTSTGLRFQYERGEATWSIEPHITVMLNSGAEIGIGSGNGTPTEDGSTWNCSHHWQVPVDLNEVSALRIGETEIALP